MTLITRVITRRDVSFRRVSRVVLQETLPFPYADFFADLAVSPTFLIFSVIWMEFVKNPGEFKIANFTEQINRDISKVLLRDSLVSWMVFCNCVASVANRCGNAI